MNRSSMKVIERDMAELNRLYFKITPAYYSAGKLGSKKSELSENFKLISNGVEGDKRIVSILKEANKRISKELQSAREEYEEIKGAMNVSGELVRKLDKLDRLKTELKVFRGRNASTRIKLASLTTKIWGLQEQSFQLRKERKKTQKEHTAVMRIRTEVVGLRSKVLQTGKLLELKDSLSQESTILKRNTEEVSQLKEELTRIVPVNEEIKDELEKTNTKFSLVKDRIGALKGKVERISPKVRTGEEINKLDREVEELKTRKSGLTDESKLLSPRIATIVEEEEQKTTILEALKQKNEKEKKRLDLLKKDLRDMDITEDSVNKLREKVTSLEADFDVKKRELENMKAEYTEVQQANQKYKRTIDEVEKGTMMLKKAIKKRK